MSVVKGYLGRFPKAVKDAFDVLDEALFEDAAFSPGTEDSKEDGEREVTVEAGN